MALEGVKAKRKNRNMKTRPPPVWERDASGQLRLERLMADRMARQGGQIDVVGQADAPVFLPSALVLEQNIGHALGSQSRR